jgi:hypothetical protein
VLGRPASYEPCPRARADNLVVDGPVGGRHSMHVLGADSLHMDWGRPVGGAHL